MAGNLKSRLERLRRTARDGAEPRSLGMRPASELEPPALGAEAAPKAQSPHGAPVRAARPGPPSFLHGWEKLCDLVWARTLRYGDGLPDSVDPAPFMALGRRAGAPEWASEPIPAERLRFFDLETTGLSGGSGTVAFLAAVGRREGGDFLVRQYFLEDYPGEAGFVAAVLSALEDDCAVVTYNGRSFDLPLLRTRCVMNGIEAPRRRDIDSLFAARRLWKRVHGGASLGLLEREVLGIEREEDVPGSMIPEIWFSYLREGDHPAMRAVMSHNADDVSGLARLMSRAAAVFEGPRAWLGSASLDRCGLGRTLLALGRGPEGEELLEAALADGDEGAGLILSRHYRREGRTAERRRVLELLPGSPRSWIERAKFLEHVERDWAAALALAELALAGADTRALEESASIRVERLRRKLSRMA